MSEAQISVTAGEISRKDHIMQLSKNQWNVQFNDRISSIIMIRQIKKQNITLSFSNHFLVNKVVVFSYPFKLHTQLIL